MSNDAGRTRTRRVYTCSMRVWSALVVCVGCNTAPPSDPSHPTKLEPHVPAHPESDVATDRAATTAAARRIVMGKNFACAVLGDGRVDCWGDPGTRKVPDGTFVALAAGERHACGLRSDGRVACWGWNDFGQTNAPAGEFVAVAADGWSSCGLREDMTASCWGHTDDAVPDRLRKSVYVGRHHCGLRADGTIGCTFYGDPTKPYSGSHFVFDDEAFIDIAVTGGCACGLRPDGTLRCQGRCVRQGVPATKFRSIVGGAGICGITPTGDAVCFDQDRITLPAAPKGPYREVMSARLFACGVFDDGELACWPPRPTPLPAGPFEQVAVGEQWVCARASDGRVACSGRVFGEQTRAPDGEFQAVASGHAHSCGLRRDGTLACWGQDRDGQASPPTGKYTAVACGAVRSCAAAEDGALRCWGAPYEYNPPPAGLEVRTITMAEHVDCAVLVDGRVQCWGQNGYLDTAEVRNAVAVVVSQDEVRVRNADGSGTCFALTRGGGGGGGVTAPTWGPASCDEKIGVAFAVNARGGCTLDAAGALRCTSVSLAFDSPMPAQVGPFTALSMRGDHGCALARSGELACWGPDRFGEVSPPVGKYRAVALGDAHGCAIREDHTVTCWGSYAGGVPL